MIVFEYDDVDNPDHIAASKDDDKKDEKGSNLLFSLLPSSLLLIISCSWCLRYFIYVLFSYFARLIPEIFHLCYIFLFPDAWDILFMLYFLPSSLRFIILRSGFLWYFVEMLYFLPSLLLLIILRFQFLWYFGLVNLSYYHGWDKKCEVRTCELVPSNLPFFGVIWWINQSVQTRPGLCGRVWSWARQGGRREPVPSPRSLPSGCNTFNIRFQSGCNTFIIRIWSGYT